LEQKLFITIMHGQQHIKTHQNLHANSCLKTASC